MTLDRPGLDRNALAARIAADIPYGAYVNLGIGAPTLIADHLDPELDVILHTENGLLGMGPTPAVAGVEVDPDLINAGKLPVTALPGEAEAAHEHGRAVRHALEGCGDGVDDLGAHVCVASWCAQCERVFARRYYRARGQPV